MPSHHLQSAEEQRPPPGAHDSHHDGQTADSLTESWGHGGWRAGFISASQRAWTRTCLGGHREVQISPSHSLCRTDFIWDMSLMVPPNKFQFSSVQSLSRVRLFVTPWTASRQASLSPTPGVYSNSCPLSLWCHPAISSSVIPLLLLPSNFPSIRVFSNESVLFIRWPKYWSFCVSPSNEYSGLVSFRTDWLDLLAVQGTLKSLLQHHSSKASVLRCSAFFIVQLSHPYMTTGKTKALTRQTFVGKVMSLLLNMLSGLVITFLQGASVF